MRIDPAILRGRGVDAISEGPKAVLPMQQIAPPRADCSEDEFQSAVIAAAKMLGWLVYHTRDSRRSEPGFFDLVLARNGVVLLLELKSATGKLAQAQRDWLDAAAPKAGMSGHLVGLVRPADWPKILELLA